MLCVYVSLSAQVGVWAEWVAVGLAAAAHLSFFVPAVAAISAALGIHPFRVRGAAHWYSISGDQKAA